MQQIYRLSLVTLVALLGSILWLSWAKPLLAAPLLQATADPVFVGAGDIADCDEPNDSATAALLDGIAGTVFNLGDNVYDNGTLTEFNNCYEPTWGRHFARTKPVPGNHEYNTAGAAGYYSYFDAAASPQESRCTSNCIGYYSYNLGAWHIVALNSELTGPAAETQLAWLRDDLAANPNTCTLAYWHRPLFTSGIHRTDGNIGTLKPYWETLYHYGADVILNGHDHNYERFAPQKPNGQADSTRGIRQFVVGTGGAPLRALATIQPNSEVRNSDTHGVLKLTLHTTSYTWQFVPIAGQTFTDSGTANCITAGPTIPAPVGYWRMDFQIEGNILNSVAGNGDGVLVGNTGLENNPPDNNVGWNSSATAKNSNSANFDGVSDHIAVAANNAYNLSNEVTLAAWVNLADPAPDQKIAGKLWLNFPSGSGYLLGVVDGQIQAEVYDANQQVFLAKGGTIPAATWTHVAMTWKTGGQLISYINGVAAVTTTASALPIGNKCENGKGGCNVIIGGAPWAPAALSPNGNIDEVLIFNQALSPDAIAQLAQRTFIVADPGDNLDLCAGNSCTLRSAIHHTNDSPNGALRDRIHFALPDPATIQPSSDLLTIREAVVIDGLSQPSARCATWPPTIKVALDGSNAGVPAHGLSIESDQVVVRGLNIRNFSLHGIVLFDAADNLIECNLIGTNLAGDTSAFNHVGVSMISSGPGTERNRVVRNLVSGNNIGIAIENASENLLAGNYVGANISGTAVLADRVLGITISGSEATQNRVGGATAQERNLLVGHTIASVQIAQADGNTVQGNYIGTDVSGALALVNKGSGVLIVGGANNTIGGKNTGNLIAHHLNQGVWISGTTSVGNFIAENRIHHNGGLGIDLGVTGVAANDLGDGDSGANNLQNFPVLNGAASNGSTTTISGTLNSQANTEYLIEFYSNATNDACQGEIFLGFAFVTTDANGNIAFTATLPTGVSSGRKLSATASAMTTFDTSEFSACVPVIAPPPVSPTVSLTRFQSTFNEGAGSARLTVQLSQSTSEPIAVLYNTSFTPFPGPEDATPNSDYTAAIDKSLVIPAGAISGTIAIPLLEDTLVEQNERFGVTISLPANSIAILDNAISTSVVTIADNDGANNTPPVAQAQTVNVKAGVPQPITLVGVDVDSDPLTFTILTQPQNGELNGTAPTVTYTPNPGFAGADNFTFKVNDGKVDSAAVTVSLVVGNAGGNNTPPVAQTQTVNVQAGLPQEITLVGVDTESDPLTFTIVTQPQNGTLSGTAPTVTYTPNPGFTGADSFTFKVNDGKVDSAPVTVTLRVAQNNFPGGSKVYLPVIERQATGQN